MRDSSDQPERIADETAKRLLERAADLDANELSLDQLRAAAKEAGISPAAFDAAVAEWRAAPEAPPVGRSRGMAEAFARNAVALITGWTTLALLAAAQQVFGAPWLVHKLTDPIGLAAGAVIAARLRARTATIVLGGLAVSQGAEFLMDLASGAPAIRGFGAHMGLMIAGIAGVAVGTKFLRRSSDLDHRRPGGGDPAGASGSSHAADGDRSDGSSTGNVILPEFRRPPRSSGLVLRRT